MVVDSMLIAVADGSVAPRFRLPSLELFSLLTPSIVEKAVFSSPGPSFELYANDCNDRRVVRGCTGIGVSKMRAVSRELRDVRMDYFAATRKGDTSVWTKRNREVDSTSHRLQIDKEATEIRARSYIA